MRNRRMPPPSAPKAYPYHHKSKSLAITNSITIQIKTRNGVHNFMDAVKCEFETNLTTDQSYRTSA